MLHYEAFDELVGHFHEAALRPELWPQALQKTASFFKVEGACLLAWPGVPMGALWSDGLDELMEPFFNQGWYAHNARLARAMQLRHKKLVLTEADLFTPEELDRLPFNAEFVNRQGFRWVAGTFIAGVGDVCTAVSLERKATNEPFSKSELGAIEAFLPHMRQAGQVAVRMALAHGGGMLDAFEAVGCAAILIDYMGKVQRYNQPAERFIGSVLQVSGGQLSVRHKESDDALQRLVAGLLQPPLAGKRPEPLAAIARGERRPIFVYGMPVVRTARDLFQYSRAILLLVDPEEHITPPRLILRQGFNLTQAEARLAIAIAQGSTLSEYAEAHNVTIGTARVQLKSVMSKTGTHRQAELVSFLAQLSQALPSRE